MKNTIKELFGVILFSFLIYLVAASTVFQFRNPTANSAACWTHIIDVLYFNKLEKFQGK